ncbi:hypothetical protein TorRG33x02_091100 [Trema orientale]|uniref:Uncharacterized protein n=1 Tax=Trema orientale TaxID=63057 RepID=A0A2P5FBR3_TREOI|nr:hypothetical protein TorRG33x02_091100 [Trema orientale]
MIERLDRFTTAFLLLGYVFNDYRSKSSPNYDLDDSVEMDDHGKRLDVVAQGNFDGVAGHESDFHGVFGDVRVDFHGAPPPLVNDNRTLNLGLGQDPNRSIQSLPCVNITPGVEISHAGIGDTSFHAGRALGGVDSRLPSVSIGAHVLVDLGAHGLFLRVATDPRAHVVLQGAHGLVLGSIGVSQVNIGIRANVDSHGVAVKDSHVSFKVINSSPLASYQGLSFMAPKNKGLNLDSLKKVVSGPLLDSTIGKGMQSAVNVAGPSFAQVVRASSPRACHIHRGDGSLGAGHSQFAQI